MAPRACPGDLPKVPPTVDGSLRYANVFKFALALMMWPELGRVEQSRTVTFSLSTTFFGGLARMRSSQQRGRPHPVAAAAIALETVGVAGLLAWQRSLSSSAAGEAIPDCRVSEVRC